jgi:hypothetical protein
MQRRTFRLRYVTLALVTLLAARAYGVSALPRPAEPAAPRNSTFLRFGQTLALADFDGDDLVDKATLNGNGRTKSLEVRFSHTTARTLLRFDTPTAERGSIFTSDVDHDGDNDLIWTDLLHPDDVVIWLDDGRGRFERACPDKFASAFVLTDAPTFGYPEIPHQDFAAGPQRDTFSSSPAPSPGHSPPAKIIAGHWQPVRAASGCHQTTSNRGPPSLLS